VAGQRRRALTAAPRAYKRHVPSPPWATPGGQLGFASDLLSILTAVPGGRGLGVFYWQPEWIPGVGWQPGAGTPNDILTLFDCSGRALPGVSFADPLRACAQYAPALPGACAG
jgi:arabinogalactan endo-1,4-beta-galactosidase